MKKVQRKQRLKEMKAKAKSARRLQSSDAGGFADSGGAAIPCGVNAGEAPTPLTASAGEAPTSLSPTPPTAAPLPVTDPLLHARGAIKLAEVEIEDSSQAGVTNEQARLMLQRAARFLNDVIELVEDALETASPEDRREALAIRNARPEPNEAAEKNPRSSVNKLVSLMNLGTRAANLMQRILAVTNPDVPKLGQAA